MLEALVIFAQIMGIAFTAVGLIVSIIVGVKMYKKTSTPNWLFIPICSFFIVTVFVCGLLNSAM